MKYQITVILLALSLLSGCKMAGKGHLIADSNYRKLVHEQFLTQKKLANGRDSVLFGVFNQISNQAETEGLEFLYAFMPLSDLAMNDGHYYLRQVQTALESRSYFSWGNEIPEDIFLHFVLPYRVNNEYTDTARQVFYAELKDRIKNMEMAQAALEVNHWCHEKVIYKSTDERTSGPLTTVRTAFGRCGEESTFTVAALRSVCIPARQVYTPRWAHTDDNHAWVEVWINGKWHFLGACEPEPELDMAWFAEPVKRAMMTHTFVFGQYHGDEEVLENNQQFARLNLLKNYTKTKTLPVKVLQADGTPVSGARVEYSLYNYAEFYPIATLYSDSNGICSATTGYGDLIMWASKDGLFDYRLAHGKSSDTVVLTIRANNYALQPEILKLTPPAKQPLSPVDQSKADENNQRLQHEDSIRNVYIQTFIDSVASSKLAMEKGLDAQQVWNFLMLSRGNWSEIYNFLKGLSADNAATGMALLHELSEKDLHDIQASTLQDHLLAYTAFAKKTANNHPDIESNNVLSPRIGREFVTNWRSYMQQYFSSEQIELFRKNPAEIAIWITNQIKIDTVGNYYNVPLIPQGVLELKIADKYSRNLLFVAICRSFGIPSRLEPATYVPQFFAENLWHDVFAGGMMAVSATRGTVVIQNASEDASFVPQYYAHFTISRFDKGRFITLDYENDASLQSFPCKLSLDTGYYRLVTGNRLDNGSVICNISYFNVTRDKQTNIAINLVSDAMQSEVLGKADLQAAFANLTQGGTNSLSHLMHHKGMVVALIDPSKEPTRHLMEDIKMVKSGVDDWGGKVIFIVAKDKKPADFNPAVYKSIPENAEFGYDRLGEVASSVSTVCSINASPQLPVVALLNSKGEIVWHSEGYSIGLGDQLLKQIKFSQQQ
ncbi:MAG: transglutaminase-like domain-containing protein [Lentimicrobium sp.]|nr:transglutaminase-like domain-containing protein [Lentimicrobium sp.]